MHISRLCAAVAFSLIANLAIGACPGNVLNGYQKPKNGADKWFWELDTKTSVAKIEKSTVAVTGKVEMFCADGKWAARLYDMSHNVLYHCMGRVEGNSISNGLCIASVPPLIDVTGTFWLYAVLCGT